MRYMIAVLDDASGTGTAEELAQIDAFNARLRERGQWVLAGGIEPPERALRIDARGSSEGVLMPVPPQQGLWVAGFWIVEARDAEEASALAHAASRACNRVVELRAFLR